MTHQPQSSALNMQAECSVSTKKDRVAIILKQDPGSQLHAVLRREAGKSAQYSGLGTPREQFPTTVTVLSKLSMDEKCSELFLRFS